MLFKSTSTSVDLRKKCLLAFVRVCWLIRFVVQNSFRASEIQIAESKLYNIVPNFRDVPKKKSLYLDSQAEQLNRFLWDTEEANKVEEF